MITFKQFLNENEIIEKINLFEHQTYKNIPGTKNSYRTDPGNTNKNTLKHSHVYAKPKGRGKELYSVNIDGSGHDGNRAKKIPSSHADFFRSQGYNIDINNILESFSLDDLESNNFELIIITEENA